MKEINYENYYWQDSLVRLRAVKEVLTGEEFVRSEARQPGGLSPASP